MIMEEQTCAAGCQSYTGGEIKHTPGCPHYPGSLSEMNDKLREKLSKIQRYDVYSFSDRCGGHCLEIDPATEEEIKNGKCDGEWVKWDDINKLLNE